MLDINNTHFKLLFIPIMICIFFFILNDGWQQHNDSTKYTRTLEKIETGDGWFHSGIMLRPGAVYISYFIPFLSPENSFGFQNAIFFVLISPLMYSYSKNFVSDRLSIFCALLLISSFPVMYWGLAVLNDMGSWFFVLLSLHLCLRSINNNLDNRSLLLAGFATGFGILYKTSVVSVLGFFIIYVLFRFKNLNFQRKALLLSFFIVCSIIPASINQIYLWIADYEVSYWNHFFKPLLASFLPFLLEGNSTVAIEGDSTFRDSPLYHILTFFIAFPLLPLAVGYIYATRKLKMDSLMKDVFLIFSLMVILLIIAYGIYSPRFSFLLFPVVIPLTILSLEKIFDNISEYHYPLMGKNNLWFLFLLIFFLVNFLVAVKGEYVREILGFWSSNV